jgi:type I restriction enzyme S subunit
MNQHAASRWPLVRLGDVCKTASGGTPLKEKKEYYSNPEIPWLLSGEIDQKELHYSQHFISNSGLKNSSAKLFPINSVLVAMYGANAGQVAILRFESASNQAVCAILPTDIFLPEYLYYCLFQKRSYFLGIATGNAQPNISQEKIRDTLIPLPPIAEQQRIVARLDAAFAAIAEATAAAEANLRNARALFDSYLDQVFSQRGPGWVERRLGDVCEITSNLVDPKLAENKFKLHVGAGNMVSSSNKLENVLTAEAEGLISGKYTFNIGMVLYSKIRPYLRKVSLPDFDGLCSADVYPLSPVNEAITPGFLFYLLLSNSFTDYAIQGSGRAGMPKVNREHLFEYMTLIPSITAQNEITRVLFQLSENTELLGCIFESKSLALTELKKSLLAEVFGEG